MIPTHVIKADEALTWVTTAANTSIRGISRALGRKGPFLGVYRSSGRVPSISLFCEIANACGFDVYLVRGDENIIIRPSDKDED